MSASVHQFVFWVEIVARLWCHCMIAQCGWSLATSKDRDKAWWLEESFHHCLSLFYLTALSQWGRCLLSLIQYMDWSQFTLLAACLLVFLSDRHGSYFSTYTYLKFHAPLLTISQQMPTDELASDTLSCPVSHSYIAIMQRQNDETMWYKGTQQ